MKKYLPLIILTIMFLSHIRVYGQITITADDIRSQNTVGQTQVFTADTTGPVVNVGKTGKQSWDFSKFTATQNYTMTVIDPATAPFRSEFPGANNVLLYSLIYMGVQAESYIYNKIDTDYLSLGIASKAEPLPGTEVVSLIKNTPPSINIKLPATLGTKWKQEYIDSSTVSVAGNPFEATVDKVVLECVIDAYGTAKMPNGSTTDVLRIKRDERYYPQSDSGTYSRTVSYMFYAKNGDFVTVTAFDTLLADSASFKADIVTWNQYGVTSADEEKISVKSFTLEQNYPNPFNPSTEIKYNLPEDSFVELKIFNTLGKEIALLENGYKQGGSHLVRFDAGNLPSGLYIARIKAGNNISQIKMLLVK